MLRGLLKTLLLCLASGLYQGDFLGVWDFTATRHGRIVELALACGCGAEGCRVEGIPCATAIRDEIVVARVGGKVESGCVLENGVVAGGTSPRWAVLSH